jgi:hypothetical protein
MAPKASTEVRSATRTRFGPRSCAAKRGEPDRNHDSSAVSAEGAPQGIQYTRATYTSTPYAIFSWDTLHSGMSHGLLPCSNSEGAILRIALSLADGHPVDLGPAVTRLDRTNLAYVLAAIRHADGDRSAWITTEENA